MDLFSLHKKKKGANHSIFSSRNNLPRTIKTSQKTIESYIQKLNLACLNGDVDSNAFLKEQFNSDLNILDKYSEKKNNKSIKYYPSFHSSKNSTLPQFKILFKKKSKLSISPIKRKKNIKYISPLRLDYYSINNNNKTNTIIPNLNRRNQKELFITLSENNDSYNYYSQNKNGFSTINEHNLNGEDKRINSKFNTQTDFFKIKKNLRQKTMNNFFKKVDLFDLEKSKKIQKIRLEKNKINIKKKYPPEIFNKLITLLKKNIKKTNNITKEMIGESINLKNIDNKNNNEDIEMIDMKQLEKLRNSEKIPKIGSAGQINMVNRAYSNLMDFGDDYLKLDDIDFYKRKNEIMKKYQNIRINAEVEEKPEISDKRYKILNRNNFIIKKKLDALNRETLKLIDILKHN